MKKLSIFVLLFVLSLLLVNCSPPLVGEEAVQTSSAVQIPEILAVTLSGGLSLLFTAALVFVFEKLKLDLRGFATPLAVAVSAWLVAQAQGYINTLPLSTDPWLDVLFKILVVVLVPVGALRLISGQPAALLPRK